ncbi:hypothetical protein [Furfurilactobacillus curtus]|uniref:Uncharacterized protein n=1 Tax=Furfurilactobacillus curtus TaxID=1746200 RepID=A0ABQ5JNT2_9LACO
MWHNFVKNHFVVETGLETFILGFYFVYVRNYFVDKDQFEPFVHHFADPYVAVALICVGLLALFVGLWDVHWFKAKALVLTAMQIVWTIYFVLFLWHDYNSPGPVGIGTILAGAVVMRILVEARWGDRL